MATAYPANTNGGNLIFKTGNTSAVATTALTIDGAQNATFAGTISSGAITTSGLFTSTLAINQVSLPNAADEHVISLNPPTTTAYYGGGIGWCEGAAAAASLGVYDAGSGGALGFYIATGDATTLTQALTIASDQKATFASEITSGDDINCPTKIVLGEGAAPELRLKKTDAGTASVSFYSDNVFKSYIELSAAEVMTHYATTSVDQTFYSNAQLNLTLSGTDATFAGDVFLTPTKKIYLGADTYIDEQSADRFQLIVGGAEYIDVDQDTTYATIGSTATNNKTNIKGGGTASVIVGDGSNNAYVGINTTTPSYGLEVNGTMHVSGLTTFEK